MTMAERRGPLSQREETERYLLKYLSLEAKFDDPPRARLVLMPSNIQDPSVSVGSLDVAVSTAIQCYSPGLAKMQARRSDKELQIAASTLNAGHHTTRQHVHYTWRLEGVSRSAVHDFFHAYPFYNSEQQSQRYVEAKSGSYLIPAKLEDSQTSLYVEAAQSANDDYFELLGLLQPVVEERIVSMYPDAGWRVEKTSQRLREKTKKISQEVARYILPIGQKTNMYHTLSELQLLRLFRACELPHITDEIRYVVALMVKEVADYDPSILDELDRPWLDKDRNPTVVDRSPAGLREEYIDLLDGKNSLMLPLPEDSVHSLARAARNVLRMSPQELSDHEVLGALLDPRYNPLITDVYEVGIMDPLTSAMRQLNIRFITRLSHTADSQRQRHRMTAGTNPNILDLYDGVRDYITPLVIREDRKLLARFEEIMQRVYDNVDRALSRGLPREYALLLLPNAHTLVVEESGNLFDWTHRWKQRLCYLAQEEIFFISVEQVEQFLEQFPEAGNTLLAPCGLRQMAGIKPRCPEGVRWCGKPVFNWGLDMYKKGRLV